MSTFSDPIVLVLVFVSVASIAIAYLFVTVDRLWRVVDALVEHLTTKPGGR